MSTTTSPALLVGSCFVDASQAQLHKKIPATLRAPLHGSSSWRVGIPLPEQLFMERRGWVQPVCLTVTTPEQIKNDSASYDRLFIPGEFCRQGDVLSAAAESGKTILLERGAFLAPSDIVRAVEKMGEARQRVVLVEAGSSFGYSDRVLDPRALEVMMRIGCPMALNLNALTSAIGAVYEHRPKWLSDSDFDIAFVRTALAFKIEHLILPTQRELSEEAVDLWLSARKENL